MIELDKVEQEGPPTTLLKRWLEALRSGKYKQGNSLLRTGNNKFCCLGVLCDLYDPSKWVNRNSYYYYADASAFITFGADIDELEKELGFGLDQNRLASWNDSARKTFEEIADLIEENYGNCKN